MLIYSILSIIPTETYLIITADVMLHYSKKKWYLSSSVQVSVSFSRFCPVKREFFLFFIVKCHEMTNVAFIGTIYT